MNRNTIMEQEGFKKCYVCDNVFFSKRIEIVTCDKLYCKKIYKKIYGKIYHSLLTKFNMKKQQAYKSIPKRVCYKCKEKCFGKLCKKCYFKNKGKVKK